MQLAISRASACWLSGGAVRCIDSDVMGSGGGRDKTRRFESAERFLRTLERGASCPLTVPPVSSLFLPKQGGAVLRRQCIVARIAFMASARAGTA